MSKITPQLEELQYRHLAVLALTRFGISQWQLNLLMRKFGIGHIVLSTNQLRRAGFVKFEDGKITCTESGASLVEEKAAGDNEVNRLLTLAKLSAASDCSIYTILRNAEQILRSGLLC